MRHSAIELVVSVLLLVLMFVIAAGAADAAPVVVRRSRPVLRVARPPRPIHAVTRRPRIVIAPLPAHRAPARVRPAVGFSAAAAAAVIAREPELIYYHYHYAPQQVGQAMAAPVKPNWRYEVQFRAQADPAPGGAPGTMIGQLYVLQQGVGQPSVGAMSFVANPERFGKFSFTSHPSPTSSTADVTLFVSQGTGRVEVMIWELGPA